MLESFCKGMSTKKIISKGNFLISLTMLIFVAIVFTITVITYAWYAQQSRVDSSGASVISEGLNASLVKPVLKKMAQKTKYMSQKNHIRTFFPLSQPIIIFSSISIKSLSHFLTGEYMTRKPTRAFVRLLPIE